MHQPHRLAHRLAEPLVRGVVGQRGQERRVAEQADRDQVGAGRDVHAQLVRIRAVGVPDQQAAVRAQLGVQQQHALALPDRHGLAVVVDEHPAPVAAQAERLDDRLVEHLAAARLHREPADLGDDGHAPRIGNRYLPAWASSSRTIRTSTSTSGSGAPARSG